MAHLISVEASCELDEAVHLLNLAAICVKNLVDKNYDDRSELVKKLANYLLDSSEKFQSYLLTIEQLKIKSDKDILEIHNVIDASKQEFLDIETKLFTSFQCYELYEEETEYQSIEYSRLLQSLENLEKDIEKATENETKARLIRRRLLISSAASAISVVGLIITGPLLYGALGPAQTVIDSCVKAKELAKGVLNKNCDELERVETEMIAMQIMQINYLEQIEKLIKGMIEQKQNLDQFRIYREQLNSINSEMFFCLHLIKILVERQSLLIHECPLARYADQCIVFGLHLMYDIMKEIRIPIEIDHSYLPPLPHVSENRFMAKFCLPIALVRAENFFLLQTFLQTSLHFILTLV